ncbi:MAG: hypothetical protein ACI37Z_06130 [Candidatus Gastranaerophilaceae bacterium]
MCFVKLLLLPLYILILPFKLLFGGSSSSSGDAMDDFLDDCEYFDKHR